MSEPQNLFQRSGKLNSKTGNFSFLSTQIVAWQKLTKLIVPILPQPEKWQVACYQYGVLTVTGENQAMISQLNYLQKQYISQLSQLPEFHELHKIRAILKTSVATPKNSEPSTRPAMSSETQNMLREAAEFVSNPKLSQALLRLATHKNK